MTGRLEGLSPVKREAYRRLRGSAPVSLRTGVGPVGLALAHPVGGALLCYLPLLAALPDTLPVVGFAADTPATDLPAAGRIAGLAARYAAALRRAAPDRRWVYAGWSFGGAVAYEMGRADRPDAPVVMLDTDRPVGFDRAAPDEAAIRWFFAHDLARLAGVAQPVLAAARSADPAPASLPALLARIGVETGLSDAELDERYRVFAANAAGLAAYRPGRHAGPVTLVVSGRAPGRPFGWHDVAPRLRVHPLPATDHYTLLGAGQVDVPARLIADALGGY